MKTVRKILIITLSFILGYNANAQILQAGEQAPVGAIIYSLPVGV